jgi:hypothetical protein
MMDGWMNGWMDGFFGDFFLMNKKFIHSHFSRWMHRWMDVFRDLFSYVVFTRHRHVDIIFARQYINFLKSWLVFFQVIGKVYICFTSFCHDLEASCGSRFFSFPRSVLGPLVLLLVVWKSWPFVFFIQKILPKSCQRRFLEPTIVETKRSCR